VPFARQADWLVAFEDINFSIRTAEAVLVSKVWKFKAMFDLRFSIGPSHDAVERHDDGF